MAIPPNKQLKAENTLLMLAAQTGQTKLAEMQIDQGVDINEMTLEWKSTALFWACWYKFYDVAQLLIQRGADVNAVWQDVKCYPLCAAAFQGHEKLVQLLLDNGAEINVKGWNGQTALKMASFCGRTNAVRKLIQYGADIDLVSDRYGETPLHVACDARKAEIVRALLEAGANINHRRTYDGNTPLMTACRAFARKPQRIEDKYDTVMTLLKNGADIHARNKRDETALSIACLHRHDGVIQELLRKGACDSLYASRRI